jgi:cell division protein ZapA (FtsZ GTPase activity inhibitor)
MPNITINNKEYDLNTLSEDARKQLQALQFVDAELARLQAQAAVLQTARIAYGNALQNALPVLPAGDTMKFN